MVRRELSQPQKLRQARVRLDLADSGRRAVSGIITPVVQHLQCISLALAIENVNGAVTLLDLASSRVEDQDYAM
jgi:hypothetical protein